MLHDQRAVGLRRVQSSLDEENLLPLVWLGQVCPPSKGNTEDVKPAKTLTDHFLLVIEVTGVDLESLLLLNIQC